AGQRAGRRAGRPGRTAGAALHPLLRLPERVPGLRAHRRPRLRLGLPRADRGGAVATAHRGRGQRVAAVRLVLVRCLFRRLPGPDRHSVAAGPSSRPAPRGGCPPPAGSPPRGAGPARARRLPAAEAVAMAAASWVMASPGRYAAAQRAGRAARALGRGGRIRRLPPPLSAWTAARDAPAPPAQTFREWWQREHGGADGSAG